MALLKMVLLLGASVGLAAAGFGFPHHHESHAEDYPDHHPEYKYEYSVHDPHSHDVKTQAESRQGDVVKGFYTLQEADGTTREVHYTADDKHGFNAEVLRTGHASHPTVHHHPTVHYHPTVHHHPLHHHAPAEHHHHHHHGHAFSTNNNNLFGHHL